MIQYDGGFYSLRGFCVCFGLILFGAICYICIICYIYLYSVLIFFGVFIFCGFSIFFDFYFLTFFIFLLFCYFLVFVLSVLDWYYYSFNFLLKFSGFFLFFDYTNVIKMKLHKKLLECLTYNNVKYSIKIWICQLLTGIPYKHIAKSDLLKFHKKHISSTFFCHSYI